MSYSNYMQWKSIPLSEEPVLSIIIPAYNEAERIIPTIGAIASHLCSGTLSWELIVVDDGSTDETAVLVAALELANLRLLRAAQNSGKGSAVRHGMLAARGKYLLFADADNSTPIEELDKLLIQLTDNKYQVAVGSRAVIGAAEQNRSWLRRAVSTGLRYLVRHALQLQVIDSQCGFKLYTREAARLLHSRQTLPGFSFDLEILFLAGKLGYAVAEVPVNWIDAPGSKVDTFKEIKRFLRDLLKIRINDWRGIYETDKQKNVIGDCYYFSTGSGHFE